MLRSQRGADTVQRIVKHLIAKVKVNDTQRKGMRSQGDDAIVLSLRARFSRAPSSSFLLISACILFFLLPIWVLGNIVPFALYGFNTLPP